MSNLRHSDAHLERIAFGALSRANAAGDQRVVAEVPPTVAAPPPDAAISVSAFPSVFAPVPAPPASASPPVPTPAPPSRSWSRAIAIANGDFLGVCAARTKETRR